MDKKVETWTLVTGGNGEIGSAIVEQLRSEQHNVLAPTSKELNLLSSDSIKNWLQGNSQFQIGTFVAVAGVNRPKPLTEQKVEDIQQILQVNLLGHYQLLTSLLPQMLKHRNSKVVFISSAYAKKARAGRSAYSMSKASLDALMKSVSIEFASEGLLANSVAPGFVSTKLTRQNNSPETIAKLLDNVPLGRLSLPLEVAKVVSFLVSEENTYVTGQVINVDGGFSIS